MKYGTSLAVQCYSVVAMKRHVYFYWPILILYSWYIEKLIAYLRSATILNDEIFVFTCFNVVIMCFAK